MTRLVVQVRGGIDPQAIAACFIIQTRKFKHEHRSKDLDALRENATRALMALLWFMFRSPWPSAWRSAGLADADDWRRHGCRRNAVMAHGWQRSFDQSRRSVALMGDVAVFTSQFAGHPWQIDVHMYFFAMLACLVAYCDIDQSSSAPSPWRASPHAELPASGGGLSRRL